MVAEMDRLLDNYNYVDTARILNKDGFKTGAGLPFDTNRGRLYPKGLWAEEPI